MRYFIENSVLKVEIDSLGAEVKSVLNKNNYREYMWYGNKKYWGRTSPILFPFVGGLKGKSYSCEGISYPMGQHGFARDMEFSVVSEKEDSILFSLKSSATTLAKYPFDFELIIGYSLSENNLKVSWEVKNPSDSNMYFSIGAHPAFLCPVHGEENKAGYKLYFEGVNEIRHHGNEHPEGLSVKEDLVLPLEDNRAIITETFFDRCTYIVEGNQTKKVALEDPNGKRFVELTFDTPLFAIWSPEKKNAPFICIEPWFGRADDENFEGELKDREFGNTLCPNESFNAEYTITYYEI